MSLLWLEGAGVRLRRVLGGSHAQHDQLQPQLPQLRRLPPQALQLFAAVSE